MGLYTLYKKIKGAAQKNGDFDNTCKPALTQGGTLRRNYIGRKFIQILGKLDVGLLPAVNEVVRR